MATVADIKALGYTADQIGETPDGKPLWLVNGPGFSMPLPDDAAALQTVVDSHADRVTRVGRERNRDQLKAKLGAVRDALRQNYANWPSMTAAQKDAANRNAQRAIANLVALAADQLDDAGV